MPNKKQQTGEEFFNQLDQELKSKRKEKLFVAKTQFEDVSGFNMIEFCRITNDSNPTEFVILTVDPNGKELAVSLISKSDIPRMIRELTKFI